MFPDFVMFNEMVQSSLSLENHWIWQGIPKENKGIPYHTMHGIGMMESI